MLNQLEDASSMKLLTVIDVIEDDKYFVHYAELVVLYSWHGAL